MISEKKMILVALILFSVLTLAFIGCSGGSDSNNTTNTTPTATTPTDTPEASSPQISVLPDAFDFGTITSANSAAPLEVTIQNTGTANLVVSDIGLSDTVNFVLNVDNGTNPCDSTTPTISAGNSCIVTIEFLPQDTVIPTEGIDYDAILTIQSNDPATPAYEMSLSGKRQDITEINVKINQIDACPRVVGTPVKAYVSVTDQGGFPVTTLDTGDFSLTESGSTQTATTTFVSNSVSLSVALLMDYSYSITQEPDNVTDMENAALDFIDQLGDNDEAEIIKYAATIEVTQAFTSDKALLRGAIQSTPHLGAQTAFYDSIDTAIANISARTKDRTAIVIITDGEDNDGFGDPLSTNTLDEIIAEANAVGVPVFTVGLGDRVDPSLLQQIADETGGTFSPSTTSDNLTTIYGQLADLLFTDQYVLTYNTTLGSTESGDLEVTATYAPGISDTDTKTILTCQ